VSPSGAPPKSSLLLGKHPTGVSNSLTRSARFSRKWRKCYTMNTRFGSCSRIPACRGREVIFLLIEVDPISWKESEMVETHSDDALIDVRESIGTRFIRFYRHRREPVPWVGRWKDGRCFRHPRTINVRRANCAANTTREIFESHGALKIRPKRSWYRLPNTYDDIFLRHQRSWKKNPDGINRRIHSPPFWVC
jgi:hypothetical protein